MKYIIIECPYLSAIFLRKTIIAISYRRKGADLKIADICRLEGNKISEK